MRMMMMMMLMMIMTMIMMMIMMMMANTAIMITIIMNMGPRGRALLLGSVQGIQGGGSQTRKPLCMQPLSVEAAKCATLACNQSTQDTMHTQTAQHVWPGGPPRAHSNPA